MKKNLVAIALACAMVFSFAATAMADHSPLFYFDFQPDGGVVQNTSFEAVFPSTFNVTFNLNNGAAPHGGYSQSTAMCGVCHAVHRAPTGGTSSFATADQGIPGNAAVTSSRYSASAWTSEASTQMLLRSTAARSCIYCHVILGAPRRMYAGDASLAVVGDTAFGWGQFYGHTTGCTSCHAVHGANTFKGLGVSAFILKHSGVKNLGTIPLVVQPEVYGTTYNAAGVPQVLAGSLYTSKANMLTGHLSPTAVAAGVGTLEGAVSAQCTICHASYSVGEEIINANYMNAELFQPASWATANGATTKIWVGNVDDPAVALPGVPGLTYTGGTSGAMTGSAGSLIMSYKNHPLKAAGGAFAGAGASAGAMGLTTISDAGSSSCLSCHDAPESQVQANYYVQSFPHYSPGYYKFMTAQNQGAFNTPSTNAQFANGRQAYFNSIAGGGRPAIMNDGYCTKCHSGVGINY